MCIRDSQYPEGMAPVLARGHGARVWDVDGNEFVEYGMGMRAVTLGHGYAPVLDAVRAALLDGVSFTRPTGLELDAAEDFLRVVPGADMVKFCKNASDATSAALRLARAATGREVVAMCRDQPYFASQDWFVGTLPINTGVPDAVRSLVRTFPYNDLAALQAVLEAEPVACVILEAASALSEPEPGFLDPRRPEPGPRMPGSPLPGSARDRLSGPGWARDRLTGPGPRPGGRSSSSTALSVRCAPSGPSSASSPSPTSRWTRPRAEGAPVTGGSR